MGLGCRGGAPSESRVLSRIGDRLLTLDQALADIPDAALQADSSLALQEYTKSWERRTILSVEAERRGLSESPSIRRQVDMARDQVLSDALIRFLQSQLDTVVLTPSDWDFFFKSNPVVVKVSEPSLKVYHFYHSDRDSISSLQRSLSARASKDQVLGKLREERRPWWVEQQLPRPVRQLEGDYPKLRNFWRASVTGKPSDLVFADDQWHFFWIESVIPAGSDLDSSLVRPYIEDWLLVQKKNRRLRALEQSIIINAQQSNLLQRQ